MSLPPPHPEARKDQSESENDEGLGKDDRQLRKLREGERMLAEGKALGELATQLDPQNLSGRRRVTTPILF